MRRNAKYSSSIVYKLSAHPLRAQILGFLTSLRRLVAEATLVISPQLLVYTHELQNGGVMVVVGEGVLLCLLLLAEILVVVRLTPR